MSDLPPPLMVSDLGSFAEYTIAVRKPQIAEDVLASNSYPSPLQDALRALLHEMASGQVLPLREVAPDSALWHEAWRPWQGHTWSQLPWFFAETYFYRRLLEAVRYFQPGEWQGVDPFAPQKRQELERAIPVLGALYGAEDTAQLRDSFTFWLHRSLWGNRADLSNLQVARSAQASDDADPSRLLIDHTAGLWEFIRSGAVRRLDWICDNAGLELLSDLALADWLLRERLVQQIRLHLKGQPFYVSDALSADVDAALAALYRSDDQSLTALAARTSRAREEDRLSMRTHPFWTSCYSFWSWPPEVQETLASADLILFKGDVNYRRLLDDRHWPPTTDLAQVTRYVPAPFAALRTLKGEIMVGLAEGKAEQLAREDPQWLVNGERGLVHFVPRSQASGAASAH